MSRYPIGQTGVKRLSLSHFRNYLSLRLELSERPVVLTGPNGAGKTNLLEAVSFLAPGKGLRRAKLSQITAFQEQQKAVHLKWAVAATVETPEGDLEIGTGLEVRDFGEEKRVIHLNGAPLSSQASLLEMVGVLWLTPQMDRLFLEGASTRRRFLDRLVAAIHPEHTKHLYRYEYALRERSRLLRQRRFDPLWLKSLEDQLASEGVIITLSRHHMALQLAEICLKSQSPFPQALLFLEGSLEEKVKTFPALTVEEMIKEELSAKREEDAEAGGATIGPHLSDLKVFYHKTPAELCSTGEQKALLLSLVMAHARLYTLQRGITPLLLLDEVVAHLDPVRRAYLFEEINNLGLQAWLTGTEQEMFKTLKGAQFFKVEQARLFKVGQ